LIEKGKFDQVDKQIEILAAVIKRYARRIDEAAAVLGG